MQYMGFEKPLFAYKLHWVCEKKLFTCELHNASTLAYFGLSMHNKAKTEAVFYLSAAQIKNLRPIDTQDIDTDTIIVSFTTQFKY